MAASPHLKTQESQPKHISSEMDSSSSSPSPSPTYYPSSYTKFNSALNAGLLNPMSPPPDKTRSSPTLFDMMSNEHDYHPKPHNNPNPARDNNSPLDRQLILQNRIANITSSSSPGNIFNDQQTGDVRLTLTSKDSLTATLTLHRHILTAHSRFFASKLRSKTSNMVDISECDDVETYAETLRLMYCTDLRRRLMREDVSKVLDILKISSAISFDAAVLSCLEYLEAAPWAEDEEEKVAALLTELDLDAPGAGEVLKRVSVDAPPPPLPRLIQVVLEGKDEKARREMKGLVSKMLRESGGGGGDLSKESLYSACSSCLQLLRYYFTRAAASDASEAAQIARQADNLHWMLDILIDRQIADEFLRIWAGQSELAELHLKVPVIHRYEVSRVTARLFVGIGKGQVLVSKETRCLLLKTWLDAFYEDFGWMRRACKGLDRHSIEDGLGNTILTLPLGMQQEILMAWFDRFLNSGDDCPNLQRGFEAWWRRAFWRRNGEQERPPQLRIAAACENSC